VKVNQITRRKFGVLTGATLASVYLPKVAISVAAASEPVPAAADRINPLIGASTSVKLGEGKTFPGATTPFGLVQLSPDTITGGDQAPGYSYDHTTIEGFSFLHMSGVGWYGDFGNLQVMPTTGPMKLACGRLKHPGEGWRSRFNHKTEKASANYYAVTLDDYIIRTEVAASQHAGILRFTYPDAHDSRIQIDLARRIAGTSTRQSVKVTGSDAIEGWMQCTPAGGGWGNGDGKVSYTIYFRMEFSKPLKNFGVWSIPVPEAGLPSSARLIADKLQSDEYYALVRAGKVIPGCTQMEGTHLGFYTEFATRAGEQVLARAGISFVSVEGARRNLAHDIPDWDFESVRQSGRQTWSEALAKIETEGGTETQKTIFATALYHAMIDPRSVSDVDGRFRAGDGQIKTAKNYRRRTVFSGWDVFRAEFPLMTIIDPAMISDEINSLVDLAGESGKGYLERWEIMNAYSGCMDGDPAISVIADAYRKGIRTFNIEKAYAACLQTASGTAAHTNRPDNEFYLNHGYVPGDVSWTLDNAYFDWCVGTLAQALGKTDDAKKYFARAANYKNIYDPAVQSMHAKDKDGEWTPWKGKTTFGQGCTESNPYQQTWFVPHDVQGLIEQMGSETFVSSLEEFFEKTPSSFGWNEYYNHSNEPVHHIAYLFVYAGMPWLTQKWVRRILDNAYHNDVNGICGNDDVGQMSAWYVLSALGFYPVCPGDNTYIIGSPIFSRATIKLDPRWHKGKTFAVAAKMNSARNVYVQAAKLNGKPLTRAWITHDEITAGGVLELTMGPDPNKEWGAGPEHLPPSMSRLNLSHRVIA
jgi:predicted alpha-1,2-mannosidase